MFRATIVSLYRLVHTYAGAEWRFSSAENRDQFIAGHIRKANQNWLNVLGK